MAGFLHRAVIRWGFKHKHPWSLFCQEYSFRPTCLTKMLFGFDTIGPRTPSKIVDQSRHSAQYDLRDGQYFLLIRVSIYSVSVSKVGTRLELQVWQTKFHYSSAPHKTLPCFLRGVPQCWRVAEKFHPPRNEKNRANGPVNAQSFIFVFRGGLKCLNNCNPEQKCRKSCLEKARPS